jgi:hypothetical protein
MNLHGLFFDPQIFVDNSDPSFSGYRDRRISLRNSVHRCGK